MKFCSADYPAAYMEKGVERMMTVEDYEDKGITYTLYVSTFLCVHGKKMNNYYAQTMKMTTSWKWKIRCPRTTMKTQVASYIPVNFTAVTKDLSSTSLWLFKLIENPGPGDSILENVLSYLENVVIMEDVVKGMGSDSRAGTY